MPNKELVLCVLVSFQENSKTNWNQDMKLQKHGKEKGKVGKLWVAVFLQLRGQIDHNLWIFLNLYITNLVVEKGTN